jgi:predicted aspartyl protease
MKIDYRNGLIFTSLEITYKGKTKIIDNIVIDTGASGSIIAPDAVDDVGIYAELGDRIMEYYGVGGSVHNAFIKEIDKITLESQDIENIEIDFGLIDTSGEINGLLGLDILMKIGALIDLKNLKLRVY